jgi:hypothetical protein
MSFWLLSPDQRIRDWRKFRKELDTVNDDLQCLKNLVEWWKLAPVATRAVDPYDSNDWPDPWELLYNGNYDENVIAIGMAQTLELIDWPCDLHLVQNTKQSFIGLIVSVDNEFVLNYTYGIVEDYDRVMTECVILHSWKSSELT